MSPNLKLQSLFTFKRTRRSTNRSASTSVTGVDVASTPATQALHHKHGPEDRQKTPSTFMHSENTQITQPTASKFPITRRSTRLRESAIEPSNVGSIMEDAFNDRMMQSVQRSLAAQHVRDSEEYLQKVWERVLAGTGDLDVDMECLREGVTLFRTRRSELEDAERNLEEARKDVEILKEMIMQDPHLAAGYKEAEDEVLYNGNSSSDSGSES